MDRLTSWAGELMFWAGDHLNRLEKWPKRYYGGMFLLLWLSLMLLAHYVGLVAGLDRNYYSWVGAMAMGFLLSGAASSIYVIFLRPHR